MKPPGMGRLAGRLVDGLGRYVNQDFLPVLQCTRIVGDGSMLTQSDRSSRAGQGGLRNRLGGCQEIGGGASGSWASPRNANSNARNYHPHALWLIDLAIRSCESSPLLNAVDRPKAKVNEDGMGEGGGGDGA